MTDKTRLSRSLLLFIALLPNSAWAIDWTDAVLGGIELLTHQEVDYEELINAQLRQNATPENNFFAVLFPYVPDKYLDESNGPWVKRLCDELGCPVPAPGRKTIRSLTQENYPNMAVQEQLNADLEIALTSPWDSRQLLSIENG